MTMQMALLPPIAQAAWQKTTAPYTAKEYRVVALREMPLPDSMARCENPEQALAYWREFIETDPRFNPEVESLVALHLNVRRRVKGHHLVATGTQDTILVHAREVFRAAIISSAHAIVLMHNHPSGDPTPSEADIKITRNLLRAGQFLNLELLDHVVVGRGEPGKDRVSLREMGYFAM